MIGVDESEDCINRIYVISPSAQWSVDGNFDTRSSLFRRERGRRHILDLMFCSSGKADVRNRKPRAKCTSPKHLYRSPNSPHQVLSNFAYLSWSHTKSCDEEPRAGKRSANSAGRCIPRAVTPTGSWHEGIAVNNIFAVIFQLLSWSCRIRYHRQKGVKDLNICIPVD